MRKFFILLFLTVTLSAHAVTILPLPETFWNKIKRCTWHFSCYTEQKLGATLTTITGGTLISDLDTVLTTNFDSLNTGKIEVSTTSVASITTLSNLISVGTITTGVWNGSVIDVARQGTGTTSPSMYQVVLGNGANGLTIASSTGITGQFLTSNGGLSYPSWQTSSIDQGINYSWTGSHTFTNNITASGTAFFVATTTIKGVQYAFPTLQATNNGDVLKNNGNGILAWGAEATTTWIVPQPTCNATTTVNVSDTNNTTSEWGSFVLPFSITVNTIYFNASAVGTAGVYRLGIYNISGQPVASTTTGSIAAAGLVTVTLSPAVTFNPGIYYVGFIPVGTASLSSTRWVCAFDYFQSISGKNRFAGSQAETASTMPSAPDFTTLTHGDKGLVIRLNN